MVKKAIKECEKYIKSPLKPQRRSKQKQPVKEQKMVKKVKEAVQKAAKLQKSRKGRIFKPTAGFRG